MWTPRKTHEHLANCIISLLSLEKRKCLRKCTNSGIFKRSAVLLKQVVLTSHEPILSHLTQPEENGKRDNLVGNWLNTKMLQLNWFWCATEESNYSCAMLLSVSKCPIFISALNKSNRVDDRVYWWLLLPYLDLYWAESRLLPSWVIPALLTDEVFGSAKGLVTNPPWAPNFCLSHL